MARQRILQAVASEFRTLPDAARLISSDDRLDAVLCVLAGAGFLRRQCVAPDVTQHRSAEVEGWIWFRFPQAVC
jgi:hypothetical protein